MPGVTYSIAIQTFVYRYHTYFKSLLAELDRQAPQVTKIVFVNGQHKEPFDQSYRADILRYISGFPNTYPIVSPIVRGCSFMWNTCFNFTDTTFILNMNDDLTVRDGFISEYEAMLSETPQETFTIGGFSAASICRNDLFDIGYFDERLLGFGEEDGDWVWRWIAKRGRHIRQFQTGALVNHSHAEATDSKNMRRHLDKYSAFNREWLFANKYEMSPNVIQADAPLHAGMFDAPAQLRVGGGTPDYYPAEQWYRQNVHLL
jgi:hypothetical protein